WDGSYIINVTSATDTTGAYTLPFTINQEKKDSRIQVEAFIGASGGATAISAGACSFVATIDHFAYHISTGLVTQRAPIFALSSFATTVPKSNVYTWSGNPPVPPTPKPIITSQANSVTLNALFKDANGPVQRPGPAVHLGLRRLLVRSDVRGAALEAAVHRDRRLSVPPHDDRVPPSVAGERLGLRRGHDNGDCDDVQLSDRTNPRGGQRLGREPTAGHERDR